MIPHLPGDPRNREELADWLKRRQQERPGEALTPREWLMIKTLRTQRPRKAIT